MFKLTSKILFFSVITSLSMTFADDSKVNIIAKKQADSELTALGFTIGKSTLDEVKTKFQSKEFIHEADAASGIKILCYKAANGSTIAFESGDKGRQDNVITSISINGSEQPYRLGKQCEKTSLIKAKLGINGVSLGMSSDLIKMVKGKPSASTADSIVYQYEVKEKVDKDETTIISNMSIRMIQNAVSSITVTKAETKFILQ